MNDREKKLLVLVGIIVFLILNLAAWSLVYSPRKKAAEATEKEYVDKVAVAQVQGSNLSRFSLRSSGSSVMSRN